MGRVGVAVAESSDQVALTLAGVAFVSRRALRNVQIVDPAGRDVVDETYTSKVRDSPSGVQASPATHRECKRA